MNNNNNTAEKIVPLRNAMPLEGRLARIRACWEETSEHYIDGVIKTGEELIAAQDEHGKTLREMAEQLPFDWTTAGRLMLIARKFGSGVVARVHQRRQLPLSWGTLYELSKLPDDIMTAALADGRIHPKMERKDARALKPPKAITGDSAKILELLKSIYPKGLTREAVGERLGFPHGNARRITDLIRKGLLTEINGKAKAKSGKSVKLVKYEPNPSPPKTKRKDRQKAIARAKAELISNLKEISAAQQLEVLTTLLTPFGFVPAKLPQKTKTKQPTTLQWKLDRTHSQGKHHAYYAGDYAVNPGMRMQIGGGGGEAKIAYSVFFGDQNLSMPDRVYIGSSPNLEQAKKIAEKHYQKGVQS